MTLRVPVGIVAAGGSFAPTQPLPLLANLTTLLPGTAGSTVLTFTAVGGGVQLDDVYVDPFKTN